MEKSQIGIESGLVNITTSLGTVKLQIVSVEEGGTFDVHLKIPAKLSAKDKETLATMFATLAQGLMVLASSLIPPVSPAEAGDDSTLQ